MCPPILKESVAMTSGKHSSGLKTIFSFFLGLILTAFIGVGVYTFHPEPDLHADRIQELNEQENEIRGFGPSRELSEDDRELIQDINRERSELHDAQREALKPWGMRTSIILIVFATLAMAVSLIRADQLQVISNGLLLGGVFTMLYGVGWIIATGTSMSRFLVMSASLVITLGLGYMRFVRQGRATPTSTAADVPVVGGLPDLERRLDNLEQRLNDAASALGDDSGS
jgi:hypothetical protein